MTAILCFYCDEPLGPAPIDPNSLVSDSRDTVADHIERYLERAGYEDYILEVRDAWRAVPRVQVCAKCGPVMAKAIQDFEILLDSALGIGEYTAQGEACIAKLGVPKP